MVTEKNADVSHDFFTDPIKLLRDGDWVTADGTTLGADNGIGVCAALALLDMPPSTKLPPLEALFTVDEETGLTGAFELDGGMLHGRTMVNLDTEEHGQVYIGCAGEHWERFAYFVQGREG
jgi:dipeptidase D